MFQQKGGHGCGSFCLNAFLLFAKLKHVKEMDKWYLSLLLQSFQIDPINNRRAA